MRKQLIKTCYAYLGLLLIVSASGIIESCESVECGGEPAVFELVSFSADWVRITGVTTLNNQVDIYEIEAYQGSTAGIRYDSIALRTTNIIDGISSLEAPEANWAIGSAMACSPPPAVFDALENVEILSDADYDTAHPPGTNLNDIISIRRATFKEGLPIPGVINGFEVDNQDLLFTFDKAPEEGLSHKLSITYVMLDGRRLSQNLAEVVIHP